jgi:phosphatidylserine decarboxylase
MSGLFVRLQYLLPHHLLCRLVYAVTRSRAPWLKNFLITTFMRGYHPRMTDALEPEPRRYPSFNAFFTRSLRPQARPIDPDPLRVVSPCDGMLSIASALQANQLLQAKGRRYSLEALLGEDAVWAPRLRGGLYATLYLAPFNYHRVHMPLAGRLQAAWHIPGRLFSVNSASVARVPDLFARNERIVCAFEGEYGPFVVVLVGALFVGSMSTVWHGEVTPRRARAGAAQPAGAGGMARGVHRLEPRGTAELWQARGAELGLFNMGSTVLLLLPPGLARWDPGLEAGAAVAVGQGLGSVIVPASA